MKTTNSQKDQWPAKLKRQVESVAEHVADYPTVEQALDLLIDEEETDTRTCRLYLLNVNQTGEIRDRKFYTVSGDIIEQDEEGIKLEIDLTKYTTLKEALAE